MGGCIAKISDSFAPLFKLMISNSGSEYSDSLFCVNENSSSRASVMALIKRESFCWSLKKAHYRRI